ncbi:redox-active disulfide protein 2 [Flavobacterium johnsoniae]|uniref:redox-active disulfide protein 2 n=1 Tax=Flavobacterium johnsoniae TaxID=986 RepID=UPI0025B05F17|nr:redox-active disulfide protein 2 [Flavobacterium johnsoniae]WJS96701.1 redox-active disulfide protein 2 [Flavobacterium johnsoniae]
MKAKKPSEMTLEELQKKEKMIQAAIYSLVALNIILLIAVIFLFTKKGFSALFVVPFSMVPIIIVNSNSLKEIRKEITLRNS